MHCAIVGAGLAGLATGYFLKKKGFKVTFYDKRGVGGGASGVASGLMHPYVGKQGFRSQFADEGLKVSIELMQRAEEKLSETVTLSNGIFRHGWEGAFADVQRGEGGSLIQSGVTVFIDRYLKGLFACLDAKLIQEKISWESDLNEYDRVIFALGGGFRELGLELPIQFIKGQILTICGPGKWERSEIGSGHISPLANGDFQIGSTYEHEFADDLPDLQKAVNYLSPKIETFLPPLSSFRIKDCRAGVRVAVKGSYLPLVKKIDERRFIYTGLGSRGLLYHGLYGRHLANMICPSDFKI